jgi:hypothetical protein
VHRSSAHLQKAAFVYPFRLFSAAKGSRASQLRGRFADAWHSGLGERFPDGHRRGMTPLWQCRQMQTST